MDLYMISKGWNGMSIFLEVIWHILGTDVENDFQFSLQLSIKSIVFIFPGKF